MFAARPALALLALTATVLGSCGYTPLYAPTAGAGQLAARAQLGNISMDQVEKNVGQRRVAQTVYQQLAQTFPQQLPQGDTIDVTIHEGTSTLAVQATAAIQRAQIDLTGTLTLTNANGQQVFNTNVTASAAYNVERTPFSTESGKTFARLTAAKNLADEITRRLALYYRTQPNPAAR